MKMIMHHILRSQINFYKFRCLQLYGTDRGAGKTRHADILYRRNDMDNADHRELTEF